MICLIFQKGSVKFLTRFYSHLGLLQKYIYATLKKYWLLNLEFVKVQTEKILGREINERMFRE